MSDIEIEPFYQRQAKEFIDMLHDNKIVNPELTRENLRTVEDYVAYMLQANARSASKATLMLEKLKKV